MYLLIDIGNTRIKWQHRDEKNIISSNAVLVEDFMDIDLTEIESLKKVIVSNVNHSIVLDKLKENLRHFHCPIIEVTSESNEELINDYTDQSTLGVDRWLAAMGAWKIYGEDIIIGKSCYDSLRLAEWSEKNGATYVSFGSMYETKSKNNTVICDHQLLDKAKKSLNIPICVIGGITKHNIKNILRFKPDMISMISGIFDSNKIKEEVSQIHAIIKNHEN